MHTHPRFTNPLFFAARSKVGVLLFFASVAMSCTVGGQPHPYATAEAMSQPQLFAPGVISTEAIEYGPTFSADGTTFYFTRRASWQENPAIYVSQYANGAWQTPEVAPFSGTFSDEYPFLTADGNRLYFASTRPVEGDTPQSRNDIWYVEKTSEGWGTPQHLPAPISTPGIESHPVLASDGTLYFHSNRPGGSGGVDLYTARAVNGQFADVQPLPFNSEVTDGEAVLDAAGRFLIFYSEREGTRGRGDLFVVYRENGRWSEVFNLGDTINTPEYEWTPALSPDGQYLFYAHLAGNNSDIYQVALAGLLANR